MEFWGGVGVRPMIDVGNQAGEHGHDDALLAHATPVEREELAEIRQFLKKARLDVDVALMRERRLRDRLRKRRNKAMEVAA